MFDVDTRPLLRYSEDVPDTKNEVCRSKRLKVRATTGQTDRQTDRRD